jgi:hypothetical protein
MHPRQAALLEQTEALINKLADKTAAPVLWKYVDEDNGEFFLPRRLQNVHSPYSGKSTPQRPEKYQISAITKELQQEEKTPPGSPGAKTSIPKNKKKKKHAADDLAWK